MNKDKMAKNKINYDFKDFFGSMQMLIFHLTEMGVMSDEEKILNILENAPEYFKLSTDCRDFFYNEGKELTIKKLMNLFFFFEHLCFEDLAKTLQLEYTKEISEEKKKLIKDKLLKSNNDVYTIKELAAADRRFISRYLAGKLDVTDINEDRDLAYELSREELWEERISNREDFQDTITTQLNEFQPMPTSSRVATPRLASPSSTPSAFIPAKRASTTPMSSLCNTTLARCRRR